MHQERNIIRCFAVISIMCVMSCFVVSSAVMAEELERDKKPWDFVLPEIVAGTLGATVGGTLAGVMLVPLLHHLLNIPECRSPLEGPSDSRCDIPALIAMTIGSTLGSSVLVYRTGARYGVRGNVALTLVGAAAGSYLGWEAAAYLGIWAYRWLLMDRIPLGAWPVVVILVYGIGGLIPGTIATIGFNLGATMEIRMMSVSPSGLELMSARLRW